MRITSGTVVAEGGTFRGDVLIEDGRITALGESLSSPGPTIDATDCWVLPGAVDPHVHVAVGDDPNMEPVVEGLPEASAAAVMGGTTTICTYVRGFADRSLAQVISDEIARGEDAARTDFAFNALFHPGQDLEGDVRAAARLGVMTFKAMMAYHVRGLMLDDAELLRLMRAVADVDGLVLVHPENGVATAYLEEVERRGGEVAPESYLRSSPGVLEAEGMYRATMLSRLVEARLLFVHLSARESAELVAWLLAGPDAARIAVETQPHYLALTDDVVRRRDAVGKIGPPLKEEDDVAAVWEALLAGRISHVSSDHSPRTLAMKLGGPDIFHAPYGGISGTEVLRPLLWGLGFETGRIGVEQLTRLTATNAARRYGLYPHKGAIRVGGDGDVVVIPRDAEPREIRPDVLHGRSDYTLYEGLSSRGFPRDVVRAGRHVVADGVYVDHAPGRYLGRVEQDGGSGA